MIYSYAAFADSDSELKFLINRFRYMAVEPPKDLSPNKYILGEKLFFEKELSGNRNISCSTCHSESYGLSDGLPVGIGAGGIGIGVERKVSGNAQLIPRNSPSLFNIGEEELYSMFWDGRVSYDPYGGVFITPEPGLNGAKPKYPEVTAVLGSALAAQALFPLLSHAEMRGLRGSNELANAKTNKEAWDLMLARLFKSSQYIELFEKAYPGSVINIGHVGEAIAHYQRHRFSVYNTPWDRYLRGDKDALSEEEKLGAIIFSDRARCAICHSGKLLGGDSFHNVVSPQLGPGIDVRHNDEGRFYVTGRDRDRYHFKTPMLRNLIYTAPYFHSGAYQTIDEVIDHYAGGANVVDDYTSDWLRPLESFNYMTRLFVETDRYMLFRKKENSHPIMRAHAIRLSNEEKRLLKLFLTKSLSQ